MVAHQTPKRKIISPIVYKDSSFTHKNPDGIYSKPYKGPEAYHGLCILRTLAPSPQRAMHGYKRVDPLLLWLLVGMQEQKS